MCPPFQSARNPLANCGVFGDVRAPNNVLCGADTRPSTVACTSGAQTATQQPHWGHVPPPHTHTQHLQPASSALAPNTRTRVGVRLMLDRPDSVFYTIVCTHMRTTCVNTTLNAHPPAHVRSVRHRQRHRFDVQLLGQHIDRHHRRVHGCMQAKDRGWPAVLPGFAHRRAGRPMRLQQVPGTSQKLLLQLQILPTQRRLNRRPAM